MAYHKPGGGGGGGISNLSVKLVFCLNNSDVVTYPGPPNLETEHTMLSTTNNTWV